MSGAGLLRIPDCAYDAAFLDGYGIGDTASMLPIWSAQTR